jgi:signal transduction histidine kinase
LAVIGLELESVYRSLRPSFSRSKRQLRAIHRQITELSDDLRHLAYQFHHAIVEDLGLVIALQRFVNDFVRRTAIKARLIKRNVPDVIATDVATCLYRVAQESLGNVASHAKAPHVTVEVVGSETEICLTVRDSGVGMDVDAVRQRSRGLGLLSMTERVRLLNGSV